jgi:hypothetical protein
MMLPDDESSDGNGLCLKKLQEKSERKIWCSDLDLKIMNVVS